MTLLLSIFLLTSHAFAADCGLWLKPADPGAQATMILGAQPRLETERLVLRPFDPAQDRAEDIPRFISDPKMRELYLHPFTKLTAENFTLDFARRLGDGVTQWTDPRLPIPHLDLAVFLRGTGELIGCVELNEFDNLWISIGYALFAEYRDRGYASEALAGLISDIEAQSGPRVFFAYVEPHNAASVRVLEKLKFKFKEAVDEDHLFVRGP